MGEWMTAWWYIDKHDEQVGPIEHAELARKILAGDIKATTMLWKQGMDTWRRLDEIDELASIQQTLPPPAPPKPAMPSPMYLPARRWPRFFARSFDVWWETIVVSLGLGYVLGRYSADFVEWINQPMSGQLFGLMCLPIALAMDAVIYRVFGNTPGKALLGLRVTRTDGSPVGFGLYLERNLSLWFYGFAFGLPFVNLLTMAHQAQRLGNGKPTRYDESTGCSVQAKPIGWPRIVIFVAAFLVALVVVSSMKAMERKMADEALSMSVADDYPWINPVTGRSIEVDPRWKNELQATPDGAEVTIFSEPMGRAVVILGVEPIPSVSVDFYARTFRSATASAMKFNDEGRFFQHEGHQSWIAKGTMQEDPDTRLEVHVVQVDDSYWRIVTIQYPPFGYSDPMVQRLKVGLWRSVY
jgi:uncharacterized RDD family membrane protein YckC